MQMQNRPIVALPLIRTLGYAGLIPFIGLAWLTWQPWLLSAAEATRLFHVYSALILGFMAGVLWPVLYRAAAPGRTALLAVSFPVLSFIAYALVPAIAAPVQGLLFLALRVSEITSGIERNYLPAYRSLRWQLTVIVVACHGAVCWAS